MQRGDRAGGMDVVARAAAGAGEGHALDAVSAGDGLVGCLGLVGELHVVLALAVEAVAGPGQPGVVAGTVLGFVTGDGRLPAASLLLRGDRGQVGEVRG